MVLESIVYLSGKNLAVLYELLEQYLLDDDEDFQRQLENAVTVGKMWKEKLFMYLKFVEKKVHVSLTGLKSHN